MNVSAVIVTRGNVELTQIIDSLADAESVLEIVVWDNSKETDLSVYGRYEAIKRCSCDVIYAQDDDCLIDVESVVEAYEPGLLVANMPESRWDDYPDSALVGWGSVFDRNLPGRAFMRFVHSLGMEAVLEIDLYRRECDTIFSTLIPHKKVDLGFQHLPWAEGPERMFTQDPGQHRRDRAAMLDLARKAIIFGPRRYA